MAIVGRAKYTRARNISRRHDAKGAPKIIFRRSPRVASPRNIARARVYFARPTIAIAKIRDYSQSMRAVNQSLRKLEIQYLRLEFNR